MPEIHLCDLYPSWASSETRAWSNFITLVDLALSLHNGPLLSFAILGLKKYHDVFDRWMYMLSRKKPRYITIKFLSGHKIPSSLFSISDLEHLRIKNCIISLPWVFEGFMWLTVLNLKYFSSTDSDINNLISSCPWLNTLHLKYFEGISCLSIQTPVQQVLEVEGNFEDFHLHAPNLAHAYLTLDKTEAHQSVPITNNRKNYLKQAFVSLTSIETLSISGSFLMYLSKGCLLTKLPGVFGRLEKICIEKCFWKRTEVLGSCSLFQNAPTFRELEIWRIWDQDQTEIEEPTLHHLMRVIINDFVGLDCEFALVGLLLNWSLALEELKIIMVKDDKNVYCMCKTLMKLLALPRVSNKTKIIVT